MSDQKLFAEKPWKPYLDKGFVALLDTMGSDTDIEYAARMSYAEGTRTKLDTKNLLDFLMRHEHTSPFEMGELKFQIKLPIFIMRQLVRHRTASLNEMSMRYSVLPENDFYLLDENRCNPQSQLNKQCSSQDVISEADNIVATINGQNEACYEVYQDLLESGLARELARSVLNLNSYTEVVWKIDMNNFLRFIRLRLHPHAQKEIQQLAEIMYQLVKDTGLFDLTLDAFERYQRTGTKLSGPELKLLRELIDLIPTSSIITKLQESENLSKRELAEFKAKINVE